MGDFPVFHLELHLFLFSFYSKPPKRKYISKHYIDDTLSLDILDLKDYGPETNRGYRYVLVVIDTFSKFG